jgi:hypothetical protein
MVSCAQEFCHAFWLVTEMRVEFLFMRDPRVRASIGLHQGNPLGPLSCNEKNHPGLDSAKCPGRTCVI